MAGPSRVGARQMGVMRFWRSVHVAKEVKVEGGTGFDVARHQKPAINSMMVFFDNQDLVLHMMKCIKERDDKRNATLVCKEWDEWSRSLSDWRIFRVTTNPEKRAYLRQKGLTWFASSTTVKDILRQKKHIVQMRLDLVGANLKGWANHLTSMHHLHSLELSGLVPGRSADGEGALTLANLPRLTFLKLGHESVRDNDKKTIEIDSLSLRNLPTLNTLIIARLCDLKNGLELVDCPKLVSLHIQASNLGLLPLSLRDQLKDLHLHNDLATREVGDEVGLVDKVVRNPLVESFEFSNYPWSPFVTLMFLTLDCPRLCKLNFTDVYINLCFLTAPLLSELEIVRCPHVDVSPLILPTLTSLKLYDCKIDELAEWRLPLLTQLQVGRLRKVSMKLENGSRAMSEFAYRSKFRITGMKHLRNMSLEWTVHSTWRDQQVAMSITDGTSLNVRSNDSVSQLRIDAPLASRLVLWPCECKSYPLAFDIECPLIDRLVMRGCRGLSTDRRTMLGETAQKACPMVKEVKWEELDTGVEPRNWFKYLGIVP